MYQYLLEASLVWIILIACYYLFLRKETFFSINRWYLLNSIFAGLALPLLRHIPIQLQAPAAQSQTVDFINQTSYVFSSNVEMGVQATTQHIDYIAIVYFIVLSILLIRFGFGLRRIVTLYFQGEKIKRDHHTLVIHKNVHLPFSFFNTIFVNKEFYENQNFKTILDHELVHVKLRHSYDLILVEILRIVFWWNPVFMIYKKALKETHEYMADAYAVRFQNIKNYGQILLGHSSTGFELALTHQFFNSLLKKRIIMLTKKKSAKHKFMKYLIAVPLVLFMAIVFSSNTILKSDPPQELVLEMNTEFEKSYPDFPKEDRVHPIFKQKNLTFHIALMDGMYQDFVKSYPEHEDYIVERIQAETTRYFKCYSVKAESANLIFTEIENCNEDTNENDKLVANLRADFAALYAKSQKHGKIMEEVFEFEKLYRDYQKKIKNSTRLEWAFRDIACDYGVRIEYGHSDMRIFNAFMFIVPKDSMERWKAGLIPAYDNLVCGSKATPPPPPNLSQILEEDSSEDKPLVVVDNKPLKHPYESSAVDFQRQFDMTVLSAESAVEKYGHEAFEGAIEISYKKDFDVIGPRDNTLYIGLDNQVNIKKYGDLDGKLEVVIHNSLVAISDFKQLKDGSYTLKFHPSKPTKSNETVTVAFNWGSITKEIQYVVKRLPDVQATAELHEENDKKLSYFINGVQFTPDTTKNIVVDGHIEYFDGEDAIKEFGETESDGVINLIGNVSFTEKEVEVKDTIVPGSQVKIRGYKNLDLTPLYVINGEISTKEEMDDLDPEDIQYINVLKGNSAKVGYGDKGKEGVVEVFTKDYEEKEVPLKTTVEFHDNEIEVKVPENKDGTNPLIRVNDEFWDKESMEKLDPSDIATINVYKGEKAIEKFGQKGHVGVVEVYTKDYLKKIEKQLKKVERQNRKLEKQKREEKRLKEEQMKKEEKVKKEEQPVVIGTRSESMVEMVDEFTKDKSTEALDFEIVNNPVVNQELKFRIKSKIEDPIKLEIYDMSGRLMRTEELNVKTDSLAASIKLNNLVVGSYVLRLTMRDQVKSKKFIIQDK